MMAQDRDDAALYAVELCTPCWPQMLAWYRNVLGARGLVRIEEDGYALLAVGGTRLALLARADSDPPTPRWRLSFEVSDLQPFVDRLRETGTRFESPNVNEELLVQVQCWDPDGNSIRLFSWP